MENPLRQMTDVAREKVALLLIDDDPLISESLGFLLKKDYQVHVAETRSEVRALLSQLTVPPTASPGGSRSTSLSPSTR